MNLKQISSKSQTNYNPTGAASSFQTATGGGLSDGDRSTVKVEPRMMMRRRRRIQMVMMMMKRRSRKMVRMVSIVFPMHTCLLCLLDLSCDEEEIEKQSKTAPVE